MNKRWFWIMVFTLHALCFGKQLFFETSLLQDSREYLFAADNLINHHTLYAWDLNEPFNEKWLTKRPFLYPSILAFFRIISFGNQSFFLFIILLVQNLISIGILKLAERIIMRLKGGVNYKIAALLILFTPAQAIYANLLMSEVWLEGSLILILYILLFRSNDFNKLAVLTLLCIASISLKPVMIFSAFCLPVYCLINYPFRQIIKPFLLSILPIIFIFSVSFINQKRTGYFEYSSISTINLFQYNTYTLMIYEGGMGQADLFVESRQKETALLGTYGERQKYINGECRKVLVRNLPLYTYLHFRGALLCLLDPGRFDITNFFNLEHRTNLIYEINKADNRQHILRTFLNPLGALLALIFIVNLMKIYFAIRFIFTKGILLSHKLLLLFIPFYILMLTGPIGSSRFALPLFPMCFIIVLVTFKQSKNETISINGNSPPL